MLLCLWDFPGKNIWVGWHFILQGIFLTQESSLHLLWLLHWQVNSLPVYHLGGPSSKILNLYSCCCCHLSVQKHACWLLPSYYPTTCPWLIWIYQIEYPTFATPWFSSPSPLHLLSFCGRKYFQYFNFGNLTLPYQTHINHVPFWWFSTPQLQAESTILSNNREWGVDTCKLI